MIKSCCLDINAMTDEELALQSWRKWLSCQISPGSKSTNHSTNQIEWTLCRLYVGDGDQWCPSWKWMWDCWYSSRYYKETADVILLDKDLMVLEKVGWLKDAKSMLIWPNITRWRSAHFSGTFSLRRVWYLFTFPSYGLIHWLCWTSSTTFLALPCHLIMWWRLFETSHKWEAKSITRFMIWMGPIFCLRYFWPLSFTYFVIVPMATGYRFMFTGAESATWAFIILFQTGWFIESMWSQTMVIHMLCSNKTSFLQSRPSWFVLEQLLLAASFVIFPSLLFNC